MTTAKAKPIERFRVRRPCEKCPFRTDIPPFLTVARAHEIQTSIYRGDSFWCHETVDYDRWEDDDGETADFYHAGSKESVCAGSIMVADLEGKPDQLTRVAEGLRQDGFDDIRNCGVPVYESFSAWAKAQETRGSSDLEDPDLDYCSVADMNCEAPAGTMYGDGIVDGDEMTASHCPDCGETVCPSCLVEDPVEKDQVCPYCLELREGDR